MWGALPFALALIGAVAYAIRAPDRAGRADRGGRGRTWRITLGVVLTGTALLAPADQIHSTP